MSKYGLTAVLCLLLAGGLIAGQTGVGLTAATNAIIAPSEQVTALNPDQAPEGNNGQDPGQYYQTEAVTWSTRAAKPGTGIYCSNWGAFERKTDSSFLYCLGGQSPLTNLCYRYTSNTNTWVSIANHPVASANMCAVFWADNGGGTDSTGIFTLGLYTGGYSTACYKWTKSTNTWASFTAYPGTQTMAGNMACVIGDSIFLLYNSNQFYRYSIRQGTWTARTAPPTANYYGAMCAHEGKVYQAGGWTNQLTFQAYDPAAGTWSTRAAIPSNSGGNRPQLASWDVAGVHRIYCWGGGNGWTVKTGVYWFDAGSNTWTAEGTIPVGWLGSSFGPVAEFPGPNDEGLNHASGYNGSYMTTHYRGEPDVPMPNDVGVTMILEPDDPFYAFGDTIWPQALAKNFGTAPQTNVPVRCLIKDRATGTEVYNQVVNVNLAVGQTDTVDFPLYYPAPLETTYVDTMRTELAGDGKPSNDWMAGGIKVTQWGAECMTYNDGTFDNAYSWVAAGNQMAVRFFSPTKPLGVNKVEIYLSSFSGSSYASEVRIFANDGTPYGYPGTRLATWVGNLNTLIWTSLYKNEIMFDPAVSVNYDTFFASYYQTSITPLYPYLGVDYTPPVTVGNDWGQYNGTWGLWPYDGNQDMGINACYQAPLIDGGAVAINYPTPEIDSNTNVTPIVTVQNKGLKDRSNMVVVFDLQDSTGAVLFTDTVNTGLITRGGTKQATFNRNYTPHPGDWTDSAYTIVQWDGKPENDWFVQPLFVKHLNVKTEILSPRIQEVPGLVPVNIRLTNMGNVPVTVPRLDVKINPSGYSDYRENIAIAVGANQIVSLNSWVCPAGGQETCTAYITYGADMYRPDDTMIRPIRTGIPGWTEMTALPAPPSGKFVKDGGCLAYDAGTDLIYASKGNKTGDFYACDVNADVAWTNKTGIPLGAEGKPPYKGSVVCADGTGKLYLTKGNNTVGFWGYDAGTNAWTQLTNVPLGSSGKKVKQGCGLAWGTKNDVGYVYMLKGYRNEFHKYDPATNQWVQLLDAPIGSANHIKWDAGSWLVADAEPDGHLLYAFKSKYHEMYTYDTDADTWSHAKVAMPIPGSAGNKKAKDGSCAAWYSGKIYAFKGGNTVEFWRYFPLGDSWHKQDDIPLWGQSGSRKKVKAGAALAGYPGMGIFAFKGNKSNEFWRYTPYEVAGAQPSRDGVTAGVTEIGSVGFAIAPNPLAGGFATVRYSLPKAGLATLNVFDVTGRTVLEQTLVAGRTGTASLDLRKLEAGVYLVKVTTEGFSTTQKLVVEH